MKEGKTLHRDKGCGRLDWNTGSLRREAKMKMGYKACQRKGGKRDRRRNGTKRSKGQNI